MRWFVGIDISKESFDAAFLDTHNKLIEHRKYAMDKEGFDELLESVESLDTQEVWVVMESTGVYHVPLLAFLLERGVRCSVVNPMLVKHHIQSATLRKSKTDKKDALAIASFAATHHDKLRPFAIETLQSVRPLIRESNALSKEIGRLKIDIKALVDQLFPELSRNANLFTKSMLQLLLKAPSRKCIKNMKARKIQQILDQAGGGKSKITGQMILAWAKASIGVGNVHLETVLQSKIRRLIHVQEELEYIQKQIEKTIQEEGLQDFIDTLTSIPGIGQKTAAAFIGEIGHIKRFESVKQLCAYIGFDPAIGKSGSSVDIKGGISKRGHRVLRSILWLMSKGVVQYLPHFKRYYEKKRREGKAYRQAMVAVGNKLLRLIFTLLKHQIRFDPNRVVGCGVV